MTNKTETPLVQLRVGYEGNAVKFASVVQPSERVARKLGKIGEGTSFIVQYRQGERCLKAEVEAYFRSLSGYTAIDFEVLPNERLRMLQDGELDKETALQAAATCSP